MNTWGTPMSKNKIALIWDLDGTLVDSYPAIMAGLEETYQHFGLNFDYESVYDYILHFSVKELLEEVADREGLDLTALSTYRANSLREKNTAITLMPGSKKVLTWAKARGIPNFIYTHKGDNAFALLDQLGISEFFTKVLTSQSGFARKPDPEAIFYLMDKYGLDPQHTYYIGDRLLDVQAAQAAGISSLNLFIDGQAGNQKIENLLDIPRILEGNGD